MLFHWVDWWTFSHCSAIWEYVLLIARVLEKLCSSIPITLVLKNRTAGWWNCLELSQREGMSQQPDLDCPDLDFLQSYYLVQLEAPSSGGPLALHISGLGACFFADHAYDHHWLSSYLLILHSCLCFLRERWESWIWSYPDLLVARLLSPTVLKLAHKFLMLPEWHLGPRMWSKLHVSTQSLGPLSKARESNSVCVFPVIWYGRLEGIIPDS